MKTSIVIDEMCAYSGRNKSETVKMLGAQYPYGKVSDELVNQHGIVSNLRAIS